MAKSSAASVPDKNKTGKTGLDAPRFEDSRGVINRYEVEGVKFNVLTTKAGAYRSGDLHPVIQYDLILDGEFEITLRKDGKDVVERKGKNEMIIIPPNTPHLFKCTKDSVMIEWWAGPFEVEYYQPYRKFVENQFKK